MLQLIAQATTLPCLALTATANAVLALGVRVLLKTAFAAHTQLKQRGASIPARFWSKVKKTEECWEWQATTSRGYGKFEIAGKNFFAHRVAYYLHFGVDPDAQLVRHTCHNPNCVRPDHLLLGTMKDNMHDMIVAGRSLVGSKQPNSKLTEADVIAIRQIYRPGSSRILAATYGVSHTVLLKAVSGQTWRHIKRASKMGTRRPRGSEVNTAKLTEETVIAIREKYAAGGVTKQRLAELYGMCPTTISKIVRKKIWRHIL